MADGKLINHMSFAQMKGPSHTGILIAYIFTIMQLVHCTTIGCWKKQGMFMICSHCMPHVVILRHKLHALDSVVRHDTLLLQWKVKTYRRLGSLKHKLNTYQRKSECVGGLTYKGDPHQAHAQGGADAPAQVLPCCCIVSCPVSSPSTTTQKARPGRNTPTDRTQHQCPDSSSMLSPKHSGYSFAHMICPTWVK